MSARQGWNRGMPWIYGAMAIGGVVAIVAAIILVGLVFRPGWFMGFQVHPWFPFFWFFPLIGFFAIFFLVKRYVWGWWYTSGYLGRYGDAMAIARERYAKGEISKAQYSQLISDLEGEH